MLVGIDYGSKMAGTTAICTLSKGQYKVYQSVKKEDADLFILKTLETLKPKIIVIDAPLSLPRAYFDKSTDYFYRACDRMLSAMSPMFLGGLTARAMKLKDQLHQREILVLEGYPKALVHHLGIQEYYLKKDSSAIPGFLSQLAVSIQSEKISNWHQVDALLACITAQRVDQNKARQIGDPHEGIIHV